jgi:hypothetical protein
MGHRAIHDHAPADLVARESGLALGTTRAAALVELEIDLRSNFLEDHLRNDIPPERGQGLDVTDFPPRSRHLDRGGTCDFQANPSCLGDEEPIFVSSGKEENLRNFLDLSLRQKMLPWGKPHPPPEALIPSWPVTNMITLDDDEAP